MLSCAACWPLALCQKAMLYPATAGNISSLTHGKVTAVDSETDAAGEEVACIQPPAATESSQPPQQTAALLLVDRSLDFSAPASLHPHPLDRIACGLGRRPFAAAHMQQAGPRQPAREAAPGLLWRCDLRQMQPAECHLMKRESAASGAAPSALRARHFGARLDFV